MSCLFRMSGARPSTSRRARSRVSGMLLNLLHRSLVTITLHVSEQDRLAFATVDSRVREVHGMQFTCNVTAGGSARGSRRGFFQNVWACVGACRQGQGGRFVETGFDGTARGFWGFTSLMDLDVIYLDVHEQRSQWQNQVDRRQEDGFWQCGRVLRVENLKDAEDD